MRLLLVCLAVLAVACRAEPEPRRRGSGRNRLPVVVDRDSHQEEPQEQVVTSGDRQGKLFSLFNIVQFKNGGCRSTNTIAGSTGGSNTRNGTCFTSSECASKGGTASGGCAAGFGVCCVFLVSNSGANINQNCTYIRNPNFPNAYDGSAQVAYTVTKCDQSVCSLRLDFENFSIQGTGNTAEGDTNANPMTFGGQCLDTFQVTTTTGQNIPTICGQNTGQHIYVDIGNGASDTATLNFAFNGGTANRNWEIKVTQIPCNTQGHPNGCGCLQYHTGLTGTIQTFNFQPTNDNHLADQEYSVCIRQEKNMCCVQYKPCADDNSFTLDVNPATLDMGVLDSLCTGDFIGIEGASATCKPGCVGNTVNRICSNVWSVANMAMQPMMPVPYAICDCSAPFRVDIFTDGDVDMVDMATPNTKQSRGVCLDYTQIPC